MSGKELEKIVKGPLGADYVNIIDETGKILYSSPPQGQSSFFHPDRLLPILKTKTNRTILIDEFYNTLIPMKDRFDKTLGGINIGIRASQIDQKTYKLLGLLLLIFVAFTGIILLLVFWVTQRLTRPLNSLDRGAQELAKGDFSVRVEVSAKNEIGSLATSFNHMAFELDKHQQELFQTLETFQQFVPEQYLERIAKEGLDSIKIGVGEKETATILFSDIRSFTTISEQLMPQEVFEFLNEYLERMEPAIMEHQGFIDKFIGDAIFAIFNDPKLTDNQEAELAVLAAIEMKKALKLYNQDRINAGKGPIQAGIGINTGDVMMGTIGTQHRMQSTVIGDAVNLASRIEGLTKTYQTQILISAYTYKLLPKQERFLIREVDTVRVKGKRESVTLYEVYNEDPPEIIEKKQKIAKMLFQGLSASYQQDWQRAQEYFEICLKSFSEDIVANIHYQRCQKYIAGEYKGTPKDEPIILPEKGRRSEDKIYKTNA